MYDVTNALPRLRSMWCATCCEPAFLHPLWSSSRCAAWRRFRSHAGRAECITGDTTFALDECVHAATASALGKPRSTIGSWHTFICADAIGFWYAFTIAFTTDTCFRISCRATHATGFLFRAAADAEPARVSSAGPGSLGTWNARAATADPDGWPSGA